MAAGIPHPAAVDEAAAGRAGVPHGFSSVLVFQDVHDDRAGDLHRVAGNADEGDETRTGRLAAVRAKAVAHETGLPARFIAHRTAQTSAGPGRIAHGTTIVPRLRRGKFERRRGCRYGRLRRDLFHVCKHPGLVEQGLRRELPRRHYALAAIGCVTGAIVTELPRTEPAISSRMRSMVACTSAIALLPSNSRKISMKTRLPARRDRIPWKSRESSKWPERQRSTWGWRPSSSAPSSRSRTDSDRNPYAE